MTARRGTGHATDPQRRIAALEAEVGRLRAALAATGLRVDPAPDEAPKPALRDLDAEVAPRAAATGRHLGLHDAFDQGFCTIRVAFDAGGSPADYEFLEVSPSFEAQTGIKDAAGKWMRAIAPDHDQHWFDLYGRVALTGEPMRFEGASKPLDRWWSVYAFRVGDPTDRTVAVLFSDITARMRTEAALRESEARLAATLEALPVGVGVFDADGAYVLSNQAMERFMPTRILPSRDAARQARWRGWHRDGRPVEPQGFPGARALRGEHVVPGIEVLYRTDSGDEIWTKIAAVPLKDAKGGVTGVVTVVSDIDALKHGAEALRASEERFRGFAENSADVLWITDREGKRLEYVSPAFERMFGEPRDRVMADIGRFLELVHPEDRGAVAAFMPRALAGEVAIAHYRVVRPGDGRVTHLRDTGFPIRNEAGVITNVAGIVQDVNDIVRTNAALQAEKERFRTLAEGIPQLVWRAATGGEWTWASPQWTAFTGLSDAASRSRGWLHAVHPDDRDAVLAAWDRAGSGGVFEADCRLGPVGEGRWRWFQTRALPVRGASGGCAVEWLGSSTDVDDQVRAREVLARNAEELEHRVRERTAELMAAEKSLRQAQKMEAIGQLTGGIAHDFNNMLQGVVGGLDMARRRQEEGRGEEAGRYMVAARDAAERAAGLTRRLLAFARRQRLEPTAVNADALVAGMADLVRRTVGPAIEVEISLRDGRWPVLCDASELEGALLNLCINARDAMPDGRRLTIATEAMHLPASLPRPAEEAPAGDYVAIRVTDTGTGMPPEVLDRALEPFFTTKPQGQGTGLGLSQVYGFARQSGGVLRIESAPGRGTAVHILLPRGEPELVRMAEADKAAATDLGRVAGSTVLMVDDEVAVRASAGEHLRDLGYRVVEAPDGPSALRLLDEGLRPDLLVSDVGLPNGMDGRALAETARRRLPGLPVLFMTGYARVALPEDAAVITKPFDLRALAARVDAALKA